MALIMNDAELFEEWKRDIKTMAERIIAMRRELHRLLTEELKSEQQNGQRDADGQNGDIKNPKKRKASTPTLPTV